MAGAHETADELNLMQQQHPQRFTPWNQNAMDFQKILNQQAAANSLNGHAHSLQGKGPNFDMVSMEMDETGGGGVGAVSDLYGVQQATRAIQSVMVTPHHHHSSIMSGFMHQHHAGGHNLPKTLSGRKFPCKMCNQVLESKAEFQMHNQSHMREPKPYRCSQCPKSFANSSYLSQHMRIHLGIKPYHCDICKKKFTQLSHLQQHIRTHTGDKPYRCPQPTCTKAFSQLSNLQSHSRCHQQDKPFKCQSCYKCFYDEQSLLDHIPKHKDSKHLKTHICTCCGKSYTQETYLLRHMAKHNDKNEKQQRMSLNHIKTATVDPYWPKQEMEGAHRMSQEDLFMYSGGYYSAANYGNAHHAVHPYGAGQTSPVNYDTSNKNSGSAFSILSGSSGRNVMAHPHAHNYYDSAFGSGAMKSQNVLSDSMATSKNGPISVDHFAGFTNHQMPAMRNHFSAGFVGNNGMPTMLMGGGGDGSTASGMRKEHSNHNSSSKPGGRY
ncbi:Zinc finger protein rotund [Hypsibius exemplaris]|uniref:Zinc finger protein rotund n=1 Tax=Hypsibius exemplaris TaxID=2072580 RepID=A0A1W0WJU1_HYPEX|nr:Zinc finger protein rotund [Hypsibius exemplaris]